jgi:signal transduction histidine kinase
VSSSVSPRASSLWLQLLLVGGLATVALTVIPSYRAATSNRRLAERALRDYGGFAAWSYREHLLVSLRDAADAVLGAVNHGDGIHQAPRIPDAQELGHYFPWDSTCACHRPRSGPMPRAFYGFTLGSDTLAVGVNHAVRDGWLADPPADAPPQPREAPAAYRAWLNARLTSEAQKGVPTPWGYSWVVEVHDGQLRVLATRLMPTLWGDTVMYAAEYSSAGVDSLLGEVLMNGDLLPASLVRGRANVDAIDVEVSDRNGRPIFASRRDVSWELTSRNMLPEAFGGMHVAAQVRPSLAGALLIGGTPASRLPLLLGLLVLALGLTVVAALQLRREARFAAERADFVANVSHELRTPLAQVRLVLDTLRLGRDSDPAVRASALGVADREVLRLQHLVEGLLRFARGARRDETPRVAIDAAAEARQVVAEFAPLAAPHAIAIEVTGVASFPATLKRGALRQVLLNLLDNAVKYGRDGASVTVDVARHAEGGLQLTVTDAGPGVPPGERERIWRPYERGREALTRAAGGSGIGLTVVQEIAREHGGRAWVEDALGGGAAFVVTFPGGAP